VTAHQLEPSANYGRQTNGADRPLDSSDRPVIVHDKLASSRRFAGKATGTAGAH
jgi:hypothetical protein